MGLIPTPYKYAAYGLLLFALLSTVYIKGMAHVQDKWNRAIEKENLATLTRTVIRHEITEKIVTQNVYKDRIIREKGEEIIKNVPIYITAKNDNECVINNGFVRLHDSAAQRPITNATTDINAGTTTFKYAKSIDYRR